MIHYQNEPLHTYTVKGTPVAWARPRINGTTFFDSQRSIKNVWSISLEGQSEGQPFYAKIPLRLIVNFYWPPASNLSPAKKAALLGTPRIARPDIDNMVKFVMDTCSGVLFGDDAIITHVIAQKLYGNESYTQFALAPVLRNGPQRTYFNKEENDRSTAKN